MRRALATVLLASLILPALPPAAAVGTGETWDADRTLRAGLKFPAAIDLVIGPGVNVSFEPTTDVPVFVPLPLEVAGGFEVCGTAGRPAAMRSSPDYLRSYGDRGGYLNLTGNGRPGQLSVQNCRFDFLVLNIVSAAGVFTDCVFNGSNLYIEDSPARFVNCTFLASVVSIFSPDSLNTTVLSGCSFNPGIGVSGYPSYGFPPLFTPLKVSGYALVEGCAIRGFNLGLESSSGVLTVSGSTIRECGYGMLLYTPDLTETTRVLGCVVEDCVQDGISVGGNILLENCTLRNSTNGLFLYGHDLPGVKWTLRGNRIFGNRQYGIATLGGSLDAGDTRFEDPGGGPNMLGRIKAGSYLSVNVATGGSKPLPRYKLNWTDARGSSASLNTTDNLTRLDLNDHVIDNFGARTDFYPYLIRAEWEGAFCETVVLAGAANVTLLLAILPDLVPVSVGIDPPSPRAGDWVAITCAVRNTGAVRSERVQARFTLDGERLDQSELFPLGAMAGSSVRAVDWKARRGAHTVTVWLDPLNAQEENDESNNNLTFNFSVGEAAPRPAGGTDIAFAGAATAAVLALACAGGFLLWRRRRPGKGG